MVKVLRGDGVVYDDYQQSFTHADLAELDAYLQLADAVVPMREAVEDHSPRLVAMRHDIDHDPEHAVKFAEWEAERGYRSTYFMLHTAWYWTDPMLFPCMWRMVELGHEVALHIDGIGQALEENIGHGVLEPESLATARPARVEAVRARVRDRAAELIHEALDRLRTAGFEITGACQHGSRACSKYGIANQDVFVTHPLEEFGLTYEAYFEHRKPHAWYHSDNHGSWHRGGDHVQTNTPPHLWTFPALAERQAHVLAHPCHWVFQ